MRDRECWECEGTGETIDEYGEWVECEWCDGSGWEDYDWQQMDCEKCLGRGEIGGKTCDECEGEGVWWV